MGRWCVSGFRQRRCCCWRTRGRTCASCTRAAQRCDPATRLATQPRVERHVLQVVERRVPFVRGDGARGVAAARPSLDHAHRPPVQADQRRPAAHAVRRRHLRQGVVPHLRAAAAAADRREGRQQRAHAEAATEESQKSQR